MLAGLPAAAVFWLVSRRLARARSLPERARSVTALVGAGHLLAWTAVAWLYAGSGWPALLAGSICSLLVEVAAFDLEHRRIPLEYLGLLLCLGGLRLLIPGVSFGRLASGAGAGLIWVAVLLGMSGLGRLLTGRSGFASGDVLLAGAIGLIAGVDRTLVAFEILALTTVLAAAAALVLTRLRGGRMAGSTMAYAPCLAAAGLVAVLASLG